MGAVFGDPVVVTPGCSTIAVVTQIEGSSYLSAIAEGASDLIRKGLNEI